MATSENSSELLERRVTAGLRGASWDSALLPSDMRTSVHPIRTADGAPVIGYLHCRGGEQTAVVIMHPRELLVSHYLVPYLLNAGYACWVQGTRSVGNDIRLEHELAVHDVAAGMFELGRMGFQKIVLLGNSGGASLFAFYNQQALLDGPRRIERTPGGRPTKLADAALPIPHGFIFIAPHPGQGKLLLNAIDPSVSDESAPLSIDPALNPFGAENGFRIGSEGGADYDADFVRRYREGQRERVTRIDEFAHGLIEERMLEKKRLRAGEGGEVLKANYSGVFEVWRTDADLRCFDQKLDPSDRRWGSVWGADPFVSNVGSVGFARICTPESWLSTWSAFSSNASFDRCGGAIEQPTLMVEYTGDNSVFPSDSDKIFLSIRSGNKQRHAIVGNHHGQSLRYDEPNGQEIAGATVVNWLRERFETAVPTQGAA